MISYIYFSFINMSEKQNIINDIYFDRAGFGSKATTLKDAKAKDPSIRMEDVEEFFRKNVEVKKKARGENSFIPPKPYSEYQLDLFLFLEIWKNSKSLRVGINRYIH